MECPAFWICLSVSFCCRMHFDTGILLICTPLVLDISLAFLSFWQGVPDSSYKFHDPILKLATFLTRSVSLSFKISSSITFLYTGAFETEYHDPLVGNATMISIFF